MQNNMKKLASKFLLDTVIEIFVTYLSTYFHSKISKNLKYDIYATFSKKKKFCEKIESEKFL
jgi:hypothetical protein